LGFPGPRAPFYSSSSALRSRIRILTRIHILIRALVSGQTCSPSLSRPLRINLLCVSRFLLLFTLRLCYIFFFAGFPHIPNKPKQQQQAEGKESESSVCVCYIYFFYCFFVVTKNIQKYKTKVRVSCKTRTCKKKKYTFFFGCVQRQQQTAAQWPNTLTLSATSRRCATDAISNSSSNNSSRGNGVRRNSRQQAAAPAAAAIAVAAVCINLLVPYSQRYL